MKTMKRYVAAGIAAIFILTAGSITAFATSKYSTPAEAVGALTGREVQSVTEERTKTGKTYGTIANEAGVLDEFKEEMLEMKSESIAARVADGTITQEQADTIIERIEANQANCNGNGRGGGVGCEIGAGFGKVRVSERGQGGRGMGNGLAPRQRPTR